MTVTSLTVKSLKATRGGQMMLTAPQSDCGWSTPRWIHTQTNGSFSAPTTKHSVRTVTGGFCKNDYNRLNLRQSEYSCVQSDTHTQPAQLTADTSLPLTHTLCI